MEKTIDILIHEAGQGQGEGALAVYRLVPLQIPNNSGVKT